MPEFLTSADAIQHLPAVITAAASGPYGVFALGLIVVGVSAFAWSGKTAKHKVRLAGLLVSSTGCLVIAFLTWSLARQSTASPPTRAPATVVTAEKPPSQAAAATQVTHGSESPAIGSMSNASINYGKAPEAKGTK
jgi:hypothetical protein